MIGMGTFLLGMAKPALVILGVVAVFLFSTWFIPRLGEWFVAAGIAACISIIVLFGVKGSYIINAILAGTFLGTIVLVVIGYALMRHHQKQCGFFWREMAALPEVAGDMEVKK